MMSSEQPLTDDPRLTAYVLDELPEPQRSQFEAELSASPRLRAALEDLQQTTSQLFAALQTEPEIALTDEQLARIRVAACDAQPASVAPAPARAAVLGSRSSPVASSAVVLAGLVLLTAALVLSARFPRGELVDRFDSGLSTVRLHDLNSNLGLARETPGADGATITMFADDLSFSVGPTLAWDELRQLYKMEIPNDGVIETHYVAFVATQGMDGRWGASADGEIEEQLALQEATEIDGLEAESLEFRMAQIADVPAGGEDADFFFMSNGALGVTDLNGNGRLDDDGLWYRPRYYPKTAADLPAQTGEDMPAWMITGNSNFDIETVPAPATVLMEVESAPVATPVPAAAAPRPVASAEGVDKAFDYYVVPLEPLLVQQNSLGEHRQLLREFEGAGDGEDPSHRHYFFVNPTTSPRPERLYENASESAPDASSLSTFTLGVEANGQPPATDPAGVSGGANSREQLRRLVELQDLSVRFSRSAEDVRVDELYEHLYGTESEGVGGGGYGGARRSRAFGGYSVGGGGESELRGGMPAPAGGTAAGEAESDFGVIAGGTVSQPASETSSGRTSDLFRSSGDGQPLPEESREALDEALRRYKDTTEEKDALIRQWQDNYRIVEAYREQLDEAYARYGEQWGRGRNVLSEGEDLHQAEQVARQLNVLFGDTADTGSWAYTPGTEAYAPIIENDFLPTLSEPVSTFSIDVDTGSYANCRRFINHGQWPPADAVRVEEFVNAFTYNDPTPTGEHPIAVNFDVAACPWEPEHRLVRIGLRAADIIRSERPPTRLVFLIDVSGSMSDDNKLPLVRQSLHLLVEELNENDRVAVVTYANEAAVRLESTSGEDRDTILTAVDSLQANGSTNGEGGLRLAYDVAGKQFAGEASNRVILCTDGDFNVGESEDSELVKLIEEKRESGVFLSVFGFGTGNLKDAKLEQIADHGNGHYGYVDSLDEARNVFVHDLTGTLYTVAKDVKLQVDFNPARVTSYRLIGYENRALENADFDSDIVDAGDVGAGHSVTALYQVAPRSRSDDTDPADLAQAALDRFVRFTEDVDNNVRVAREGSVLNIDGSVVSERRREATAGFVTALLASPEFENVEVRNNLKVVETEELPPTGDDLLKLRVRYKHPNENESRLLETVLVDDGAIQSLSADFQWSSAVASYALLLRQSRFRGNATFDAIIETARAAAGEDPLGQRREFIDLVLRSRALYARQTGQTVPEPVELSSTQAREQAACGDRYSHLLDKLEVPEDLDAYGPFRDYGYWEGASYRDFTGLPSGYWVYVYPHWYIWGEQSE